MLFQANPANPIIIQYYKKRTGLPDYFYQQLYFFSHNNKSGRPQELSQSPAVCRLLL